MIRRALISLLLLLACAAPAHAAITPPTLVLDASTGVDGTSVTTANISPTANTLVILAIASRLVGTPNQPTVTGCSMTWTPISSGTVATAYRVTFFRGTSAAPGSACGLTVDFNGQTQLDTWFYIYEWSDADITGTNGSNGIVQAPAADNEGGASVAAASVTLASFGDAVNNAGFACWTHGSAGTPTEGNGFTILGDQVLGSTRRFTCEYKVGEDTTADISWSNSGVTVGLAIEVKMEDASGVVGPFVNGTPLKSFVGGGLAR